MGTLASVIGALINWAIFALAIATLIGFIWVRTQTDGLKRKMDDDRRKARGRVDYTEGGFQRNSDVYKWEDTLQYMEDFKKILLRYDTFGQFVPVFPLLGILGTVCGLIQQLGDIDAMYEALATSMSTTFWGLIAAIVLKLIDAFVVSSRVNEMSFIFDSFEQEYQVARDKYLQESRENQDGREGQESSEGR